MAEGTARGELAPGGGVRRATYAGSLDLNTGLDFPGTGIVSVISGGLEIARWTPRQVGQKRMSIKSVAVTASVSAGLKASIQNPLGVTARLSRVWLVVGTVASTGGVTVDIGTAAGQTTSDNCIDGKDVNAATGVFTLLTSPGTNGREMSTIVADGYLTLFSSGSTVGLVATLYAEFIEL